MKEDDAKVDGGHKIVVYVERQDASYGPLQTGSFMTEHYIDDFFEKRAHLEAQCRRRLENGQISPVAYYMTLIDLAEADLARRVGISRRRLRKHLTPTGFAKATVEQARRYARVFNVPVSHLFEVPGTGDAD